MAKGPKHGEAPTFYLKFWMCSKKSKKNPRNQTDVSRPGGRHQDFLDTRWSKTRAQKEQPGENISRGKILLTVKVKIILEIICHVKIFVRPEMFRYFGHL